MDKQLKQTVGLFLIFTGLAGFMVSLLNKKTRPMTRRILNKGGSLFIDFLLQKYLRQQTSQLAKIIPDTYLSFAGNKGGQAIKKKFFKRSSKKAPLKAF